MSAQLIIALIAIITVLGAIGYMYTSDAPYGGIGVLGGGAIWHFTNGSSDLWAWSLFATIVATIAFVIGLVKDNNSVEGRPWFWAAFFIGLLGSLVPTLVDYEWSFNPEKVTLPIGWIVLAIAALIFFLVMRGRKKDGAST